jgi:hypothetical protein
MVGKDSHASGKYDFDVENSHLDNVTQSKLTLADFLKSFEKLLLLGAVSDNV